MGPSQAHCARQRLPIDCKTGVALMSPNQQTWGIRNPIRLLAVACALTVAVLAWLGWSVYDSNRLGILAEERSGRIAALRGRIVHLDEVLTMSIRMAASTGNPQWEERYRTFEPHLDAAIKEAMAIAPEAYSGDAAVETDAANMALVEMENRAFDLVRQGRAEEADQILSSDEYESRKEAYVQGMIRFAVARQDDLRVEETRGAIIHFDEVLTMSARMAAATGDPRWEERYRTFEPHLDAAINEALAISESHGLDSSRHAALTDAANAALVEMESRAFGLVRAAQLSEAQAILSSSEYEKQKAAYARGMDELRDDLKRIGVAKTRSRERSTLSLMAAVVVALLVTVGGWLAILRLLRKWQAYLLESNSRLAELNETLDQRVEDQTSNLREAKNYTDNIIGSMIDMLLVVAPDGSIATVNDATCNLLGYREEELVGQPASLLFCEEEGPQDILSQDAFPVKRTAMRCLNKERSISSNIEKFLRAKDGHEIPVHLSGSVMRDGDGQDRGVVCVAQNITESKRIHEERERFNRVIEDSLNEVFIFDAETLHFVDVNYGARKNIGYSMEELREMTPLSFKPEFTAESFAELVRPLRDGTQEKVQFDTVHQRKDGSQYPVEVHLQLMHGDSPMFVAIILDTTERQRAESGLRQLSAAVEQSPAVIVITDTNGTIEYANPMFTKLTGYTREEAIGQDPRILKSGKWSKKEYEELWKTILAGKTWRGEFENKKKHGELYWESASISPVRNPKGEITHFLGFIEDITERKRREAELQQAKCAAEVANEAKSEFLANMSHEIRTPMTAILGFAENLLDSGQSESDRLNCIHTIRHNGEALLGIINDILDLSKVEAGKMETNLLSCEPCTIIAEVSSLIQVQADAKGLPLNIEYESSIPKTIHTDPTRLRQILINLIGNAIKFTETGAVRLVTRLVDNGDEPCLQFDVIDTGRGIPEEEKERLFQPFMQVETSATRTIGGTGLGLAISKRFAELLGGDIIVVETESGVGSTFRTTVPTGSLDGVKMIEDQLSTTVVDEDSNAVAQPSRTDLHGIRILLAEDNPTNRVLIVGILKKVGAEVTIVENGKLALDAAMAARDEGKPFDVILMDMQMPVMDGYEATGQLRKKDYSGPIIALTAHAMDGDREKCIKIGCDDYATKPIDRAKLIETIQRHLVSAEAASVAAT